jgi:O2-independent ubiquinone biosynthesis protein UbiU
MNKITATETKRLELVCPAGTPAALKAAVLAGADTVYLGFRDETNARNFPGLNFNRDELAAGIDFAHDHDVKVLVAVNTFPEAGNFGPWKQAVDDAAERGADALILADIGLTAYAADAHPGTRRHLSVQAAASNPEAINFYQNELGVRRVVLPRVLTIPEIATLNSQINVETEIFVFGGLCVMAEGRCALSSYVTGVSPNKDGACSPASHVRYEEQGERLTSRLGDSVINTFEAGEAAAYPTLCKGRFVQNDKTSYLFEEPTSLSVAHLLPEIQAAGVTALKIEGRQRGRAYVSKVVAAFRRAVDAAALGDRVEVTELISVSEGQKDTTGAYQRGWK